MGLIWEWVGEGSLERSVEIALALRSSPTEPGGGFAYEEFDPIEKLTFQARGLTRTELDALRNHCRMRLAQYTVNDKIGGSWTGYITSLQWSNSALNGTVLHDVTIALTLPPAVPGG